MDRLGHFGPHLTTLDRLAQKSWSPYKALKILLATFCDTLYTTMYTPMIINITCILKAELFPWDPCNAQNRLLECRQSMHRWKFRRDKVASGGQFVFSAIRLFVRPLPICPMKTDWTCREDRNQGVEFSSTMRFFPFISSVRSSNSHPDLLLITSTTTPLFQIHTGPQHWTFTFWATTAI